MSDLPNAAQFSTFRSKGRPKTVLFVDRNPVLSQVLAQQMNQRKDLDCQFLHAEAELIEGVRARRPNVLLLDPAHLDLGRDHDLIDFCREIRAASPDTLLIGYSFRVNEAVLRATLDAGFRGGVSKDSPFKQLEIALDAVLAGGVYFDTNFGSHLRPMMSNQPSDELLSAREKAVLIGLARGLSSKQIAHDLDISSKTVDTYKARASKKLNISDKSELIRFVHEQNWIDSV